MKCAASSETCGGGWANQVYAASKQISTIYMIGLINIANINIKIYMIKEAQNFFYQA